VSSSANIARREIETFNKAEFRVSDLKCPWAHSVVYRLEKSGEIECIRTEKAGTPNGKSRKVFREVQVIFGGIKERNSLGSLQGWKAMWPEFFTDPKLEGTSTIYEGWSK